MILLASLIEAALGKGLMKDLKLSAENSLFTKGDDYICVQYGIVDLGYFYMNENGVLLWRAASYGRDDSVEIANPEVNPDRIRGIVAKSMLWQQILHFGMEKSES